MVFFGGQNICDPRMCGEVLGENALIVSKKMYDEMPYQINFRLVLYSLIFPSGRLFIGGFLRVTTKVLV